MSTPPEPAVPQPGSAIAAASTASSFDPSVAALRGLAIILMVAGHVIGDTPDRGLAVGARSEWHWAYVFLSDVRMPLFTLLSGYVYALRPLHPGSDVRHFLVRKGQRLLIPMVVVGLVYMVIQLVTPGTNESPSLYSLVELLFYGYQHLWFLPALMLIFLAIAALDTNPAVQRWPAHRWWLLVAAVLVVGQFDSIPPDYNIFSLTNGIGLLPYFLTGVGLRRYPIRQRGWLTALVWLIFLAALLADIELRTHGLQPGQPGLDVVRIATAMSAMFALFFARRLITYDALGRLGDYSYGIYLWHVFGAAASRIVLTKIGVTALPALFASGLIAGLVVPIVIERTLGATRWGARLAFGRRRPRPWLWSTSTQPAGRSS